MKESHMNELRLIAPFLAWIGLMMALPDTAFAYAVRTVLTLGLLVWALRARVRAQGVLRALGWGVPLGLVVLTIWVLPERSAFYREWFIAGEGGTQAIAEASWGLRILRLFGSAFVIAVAEELFFREWMLGAASRVGVNFWIMVALFAVEHDRWLVGAVAGIIYGWLYLRKGLGAAIVAHMTTNLALGLYVMIFDQWQFW